jgi:hypothetical protein
VAIATIGAIERTGRPIAMHRRAGARRPILARRVDTSLNTPAPHHTPGDLARDQLGHRRRNLHERVGLAHLDLADLRAGNARFARDGRDQLLRAHAVLLAEVHEQPLHRLGLGRRGRWARRPLLLQQPQGCRGDLDSVELGEQWLQRQHLAADVAGDERVAQGRAQRRVLAPRAFRRLDERHRRERSPAEQCTQPGELGGQHQRVDAPRRGADEPAQLVTRARQLHQHERVGGWLVALGAQPHVAGRIAECSRDA